MSPKKKEATHILVVDDQRDITHLLATTLEAAEKNYVVVTVPSGEEALLEVQREQFDLIIVDYRLPGMTGLELIERIQKRSEQARFLLITGYALDEKKAKLDELGIAEALEKPINLDAFITAVEKALKAKRKPSKAAAQEAAPGLDEGPAAEYISILQSELGAGAVLLTDRAGAIRLEKGAAPGLNMAEMSGLLAESFNASLEIASRLGEGTPSMVHYYDGSQYNMYVLAAGANFFIVVIFPGAAQAKLGPVLSYGRRAVRKILDTLGEGGGEEKGKEKVEAKPALEPARPKAAKEKPAKETPKPEPKPEKTPAAEAPEAGEEGEEEEKLDLAGVEIDLETLEEIDAMFGLKPEVDSKTQEEIDALFDKMGTGELKEAATFWEEATKEETAAADGTLSREEAIKRGLIPKDLGPE